MSLRNLFLAPSFSYRLGGRAFWRAFFKVTLFASLFFWMVFLIMIWFVEHIPRPGPRDSTFELYLVVAIFCLLVPYMTAGLYINKYLTKKMRFYKQHASRCAWGFVLVCFAQTVMVGAFLDKAYQFFGLTSGLLILVPGLWMFVRFFSEGPNVQLLTNVRPFSRR